MTSEVNPGTSQCYPSSSMNSTFQLREGK